MKVLSEERKSKAEQMEVAETYYQNQSSNFEIAKEEAICARFALKALIAKAAAKVCNQCSVKKEKVHVYKNNTVLKHTALSRHSFRHL